MEGDIKGFFLVGMGLNLLTYFFADDCLIFCKSTLEECHKIQTLLNY